ncbi:hypothetical protein A9259_03480 [Vibrio cyclitrophicus]|uniref:hypothetical protein n=1 Tax=Vibrio TaxID=662 RepID=UPI0003675D2A|nr:MULTISPECIES: hypothetical protein [Vibrio]OBT03390.1 hypothetical protein A9259_03480 [Vibrio cyclitrophicus]
MEEVITIVASSSVLLGIVAYLIKSVVKQYLDKDLKVHEAQLQAKAELQLTKFKGELERDRTRIQISYSGIFERQANVIIELYGKVLALEGRLNDGISNSDAREEFHDLVIQFRTYYHENRILLPEILDGLASKILGFAINIYSESSSGEIPQDLYFAMTETKDEAIRNIRCLLSTNV